MTRGRTVAVAVVAVAFLSGCSHSTRPAGRDDSGTSAAARGTPNGGEASGPAGALDIRYSIDAARPRAVLELHVPPAGDAELLLATSPLPIPTDVLGHFRGPIDPAVRARIERLVRNNDLDRRDRGETATAEGSGAIVIGNGSRRAVLGLATNDEDVLALRAALDRLLPILATHPVRAMRLALAVRREGSSVVPTLTLQHAGTEPLEVVLREPPTFAGYASAVLRAGGRDVGRSQLAGDALTAAARAGRIPTGPFALAPDRSVVLDLPAIALPPGAAGPIELAAEISLWLAGPGPARRSVVPSARVAVPPAD